MEANCRLRAGGAGETALQRDTLMMKKEERWMVAQEPGG
jgi:hypothetical protein